MSETIYKNKIVSFKRDKVNNIIFIKCLSSEFTKEDIEEYHKAYLKVYDKYEKKGKKFFLIFDVTKLGSSVVSFYKYEGQFLKNIEDRTEKIVYAVITITDSVIIKKAIQAGCAIFGTIVPTKIVYDIEEAINEINALGLTNKIEYKKD